MKRFWTLGFAAWLHFPCRAGQGRTTTFLAFCDRLRNADRADFVRACHASARANPVGRPRLGSDWRHAAPDQR